ncbi:MAG: lactoylglutathione lyase [Rhodospirillaceae bacterium]|jgi:lactoylglutathione lyase|nr:lactoylglutathione lyase [Rhodospirillaceae bacterium]MBT5458581.1 lactoylglutathione lyase [Rhodospirillaceae bacterium]
MTEPDQRRPRLRHTALKVRDLEKSVDFYSRLLGMRVTRRRDSVARNHWVAYVAYGDEADHHALELVQDKDPPAEFTLGNLYWHINISVAELLPLCEKLEADGIEFIERPTPMTTDDRYHVAFVRDPDGYAVELTDCP